MDFLKDVWASAIRGISDRGANPLTFSFLLSWAGWNFKFLLVLFGDGSAEKKISKIESMYPDTWAAFWSSGMLFPLLTALAYVFIYPFIGERAISFYRRRQVIVANNLKLIEGARLLSKEEAAAMTLRHEQERVDWNNKFEQLQQVHSELRDAIAKKDEEMASSLKVLESDFTKPGFVRAETIKSADSSDVLNVNALNSKFSAVSAKFPIEDRLRFQILLALSESPRGMAAKTLASVYGVNFARASLALDELTRRQLVTKNAIGNFILTTSGQKAAVDLLTAIEDDKESF